MLYFYGLTSINSDLTVDEHFPYVDTSYSFYMPLNLVKPLSYRIAHRILLHGLIFH